MFLLVAGAAGHILSAVAAAGTFFFLSWRCHVVVFVARRHLCVFENWNAHMLYCDSGRVVNVSADLVFPQFWGEETGGFLARHMFLFWHVSCCLINKHKWEWRHGFCILFTHYLYILVRLTQLLTLSFTLPGWFPISSCWLWHWWYGCETTCRTIRTCDGVSEKAKSYWERRRRTCKVETQAWERQGQRRTRKRNNVRRQCSS